MPEDKKKNEAHKAVAASVKHKLPKALRDKVEVVEGGGAYSLIKLDGRTLASVRAKNVRITFLHAETAESIETIASATAIAAGTEKAPAPAKEAEEPKKEGE